MTKARRMRFPMIVNSVAGIEYGYLRRAAQAKFEKLAAKEGLVAGPARRVEIRKPGSPFADQFPPLEPDQELHIFEADAYVPDTP